jgi:hypothetical protein
VENNKITHDAYGKDRADALAAAAWTAVGEVLTERQRLIMETLGDPRAVRGPRPSSAVTANLKW